MAKLKLAPSDGSEVEDQEVDQTEQETGLDLDAAQTQEEVVDQEEVDLREEANKNTAAVLEKHRRENPAPNQDQEVDPTAPPAKPDPKAAAATAADADPEIELPGGKLKRSEIHNELLFASQVRRDYGAFQSDIKKLEAREQLFREVGGLEKVIEFRKSIGPYAGAYDAALLEFNKNFFENMQQNPAMQAFTHQTGPMQAKIEALEAKLAAQDKRYSDWEAGQQRAKVTEKLTSYGRNVPPQMLDSMLAMAQQQGMDPIQFLEMMYGPAPVTPPVPGATTGAAATSGKPWDRAKAPIVPPRSAPPGGGSPGAAPAIDQMNAQELRALAMMKGRKIANGYPRLNLGSE